VQNKQLYKLTNHQKPLSKHNLASHLEICRQFKHCKQEPFLEKNPQHLEKKFSIFQKAFRKHSIKPTIPSLRQCAKQNLKQEQKNKRQCKPNNPVTSKKIPEPQLPCTMQVFTKSRNLTKDRRPQQGDSKKNNRGNHLWPKTKTPTLSAMLIEKQKIA
jgi:hypothetical protein